MSKINEIGQILQATARANKYRVSFSFPSAVQGVTSLKEIDVIAKSATAPEKEVGMIEVWNQGRKLVIPGDTSYSNSWSLDFYLDESHKLRIDLIKWQAACDNFHLNKHSGKPFEVMTDLKIEQLDSAGNVSARYTLHNAFPQVIGEVSYGDDSSDTPAEFNVTFAYSDWVIGTGDKNDYSIISPTGNPSGL